MHFIVEKSSLMKTALENVKPSLTSRPAQPMLGCVKITAANGKVSLIATNLETESSDSFDCNVITEGSIAVTADVLFGMFALMEGDSSVTLRSTTKESGSIELLLEYGEDRHRISCLSASEFPSVFNEKFDIVLNLQGSLVSSLLKSVVFAVATGTERYNLTGVNLETQNENGQNYLCAIATDGHRLAFARMPIDNEIKFQNKIFPKNSVNSITKLLSRGGDCELLCSENRGGIKVGDVRFVTKLVDANFPDYNKVVPKANDKVMEMDKTVFLNGIKSASVQVKHEGVKFIIRSTEIELRGSGPDGSQSSAKRPCTLVGAEEFKITHNPVFVEEAVSHMIGDKIRMSFKESLSPMMIQSVENGNFYHVVMPMKVAIDS